VTTIHSTAMFKAFHSGVAALAEPDIMIEIEAVAVLP
jgi:enamine deaminase RidA (YjgF/YER057c/UK114 family)